MFQSNRDDYSLQELGERFALLSEQAVEYALFLVSTDGTINTWNPGAERLFGYHATEIVGKKYDELFSVDDVQAQVPETGLNAAFAQGKSVGNPTHKRKNGSMFQCRTTATAILDENDEVHVYAVVVRDNTTSDKAISQAKRVSELIAYYEGTQSFFSILAHELSSPLVPIYTAIELLRRAEPTQSMTREVADLLNRQVDVLRCLVNDMLDVSRITNARLKVFREPTALNQVVQSACRESQPTFDTLSQQLNLSFSPGDLWVNLDRARIHQIIKTLLSNAAKFTPAGGNISVSVTSEGDQAIVRVRDNGIGLKQSMIPHIFDLSSGGDEPIVKARGGLGLGLAISRSIAELHDGSLTATSCEGDSATDVLEEGSEFTLRLPLCETPLPEAADQPVRDLAVHGAAPSTPQSNLLVEGPVRVLVISDQMDFANALRELLDLSGCEVRCAASREDALSTTSDFCPQVTLLDMELQMASPYAIAQQVDNVSEVKNRMLIALTNGPPSESEIVRSLNSRFDGFLEKPIDFARLKILLNAAWHAGQSAAKATT